MSGPDFVAAIMNLKRTIFRYGVLFSGIGGIGGFGRLCRAKVLIVAVGVFAHQIGLDKVPNRQCSYYSQQAHLIFETNAGRRKWFYTD